MHVWLRSLLVFGLIVHLIWQSLVLCLYRSGEGFVQSGVFCYVACYTLFAPSLRNCQMFKTNQCTATLCFKIPFYLFIFSPKSDVVYWTFFQLFFHTCCRRYLVQFGVIDCAVCCDKMSSRWCAFVLCFYVWVARSILLLCRWCSGIMCSLTGHVVQAGLLCSANRYRLACGTLCSFVWYVVQSSALSCVEGAGRLCCAFMLEWHVPYCCCVADVRESCALTGHAVQAVLPCCANRYKLLSTV